MLTQFNVYVAEQTRQQEITSEINNNRLVRQAERARRQGQKAFGTLLIRSGQVLVDWGCRIQGRVDCGQVVTQAQ